MNSSPLHSSRFVLLSGLFVAALIVSNVIAGRLVDFFGVVLPAAVLLFPVTYILGDIFTEVYGYQRSRLVIWLGFFANLVLIAFSTLAVVLPAPGFFQDQSAWATVLGMAPRVAVASLIAYWAGEFGNAAVLSLLKKATKGRWLWTRTIGSTLVGQALDTGLFISIAFFGLVPAPVLIGMIVAQYLFKVGYEVVFTPVTYAVVGWLKRKEGIDTFDEGISYNPFGSRTHG
jgi:uncharacterized integral membrane protein (TIGR00697 family)